MERARGGPTGYSKDGYIVDQARLKDVPYGCRTSDHNGCGWIAAYNLLRCLGDPATEAELTKALSRRSLFRGRLGTSPFKLIRLFKERGYQVKLYLGKKRAAANAAEAGTGLLLYRHRWGWHYVAFTRSGAGEELRFFNASPGNERHVEPMAALLARDSAAPFAAVLAVYQPKSSSTRNT